MKKLMLAFTALVLAVACNKDSDSPSQTIAEGTFPKKIIFKNTLGKIYLVQNHTFADGKIQREETENYDDTGNVSSRETTVFTYSGDLIVKEVASNSDPERSYVVENTYNSDKKLEKRVRTGYKNISETTYSYEKGQLVGMKGVEYGKGNEREKYHYDRSYTYEGNTITETRKSYKTLDGVEEGATTYISIYTFENDNLVKQVNKYSYGDATYDYSYDNKNNPKYQSAIKSLNPTYFTDEIFSKNNVTQVSSTHPNGGTPSITVWEYEYNANGYPTKKTIKENSVVVGIEEYEY